MAVKHTDPVSFLTNIVARKGRSELVGVYLTGVNVTADANTDYGYSTGPDPSWHVRQVFQRDKTDWDHLLVDIRRNREEMVHPISFHYGKEPVTVYFLSEGNDMSAMVFIPTLAVEEFASDVVFFQQLLHDVAHFAGQTATTIRFTIGVASMEWDDVVERGCAREVDVGF